MDEKKYTSVSSQLNSNTTSKKKEYLIIFVLFLLIVVFITLAFIYEKNNKEQYFDFENNIFEGNLKQSSFNNNELNLYFKYNGPTKINIDLNKILLPDTDCKIVSVENLNSNQKSNFTMLNGQNIYAKFNCNLSIEEKYIESEIKINLINGKTGLEIPVKGKFLIEKNE